MTVKGFTRLCSTKYNDFQSLCGKTSTFVITSNDNLFLNLKKAQNDSKFLSLIS